jgi:hypothetical protein
MDPCAGKHPASASFKVYENIYTNSFHGLKWIYYDTDTIWTNSASFIADDSTADDYEWHIGSEIIKTRSFSREKFPRKKNIPVTLIVRKKPNISCFPYDDGVDTLTRNIYIMGLDDSTGCREKDIFTGDYYGYNTDSPSNYFTIILTACYPDTAYKDYPVKTIRIQNLTPGSDISHWYVTDGGYREYYFWACNDFKQLAPEGIVYIYGKNYDSLEINYSIQKAPGWEYHDKRIFKTFKGVRIK